MNERLRSFEEIINWCHVRSSIYRKAKPNIKYSKNHNISFYERVPLEDQKCNDWLEYDPRDDDGGSLFMFND